VQQKDGGEAVVVEIPGTGPIYALLSDSGDPTAGSRYMQEAHLGGYVFAPLGCSMDFSGEQLRLRHYRREQKAAALFDETSSPRRRSNVFPVFARFTNPSDPRSIEVLDEENLAESLGRGVRLRRVTVELTPDPVTETIVQRLPWLATQEGPLEPYEIPVYRTSGDIQDPDRILTSQALKSAPSE
jgi:hypothetical protein